MKKITATNEQLSMDFELVSSHAAYYPATLIYELSTILLKSAADNDDPIMGKSFQLFVANMVDCCHGVKKPSDSSPYLLSEEGLKALYSRDVNPRDMVAFIIAILTTVNTALPNCETPEQRHYVQGLYTAQASFVHALAEYIKSLKPNQNSDS